MCLYPLYIDKFSNLGVVKFTAVCTLFWAFCAWLGALALVGARPAPDRLRARDPSLWALGAFVLTGLLSTVLSLSPVASLWGLGGYYGGFMMVLFTAAGYLAVRAFAPQGLLNGLTFCVGLTTIVVTVLYVLNIFNIDLIGAYEDTAVIERAPVLLHPGAEELQRRGSWLLRCRWCSTPFWWPGGPRHTLFYGVPAFFGGLALAVVDAEGLALGIGAAVLVLMCQKIFTTRTVRRLAMLGGVFLLPRGLDAVHAGTRLHPGRHADAGGPGACGGHRLCGVARPLWAVLWFGLRRREIPLWRAGRRGGRRSGGGRPAAVRAGQLLARLPQPGAAG